MANTNTTIRSDAELLLEHPTHPSRDTRLSAVENLWRYASQLDAAADAPECEPLVVDALRRATDDADREIRWHAIQALGQLHEHAEQAVPDIIARITSPDEYIRVRETAIIALSQIPSSSAVEFLKKIADNSERELSGFRELAETYLKHASSQTEQQESLREDQDHAIVSTSSPSSMAEQQNNPDHDPMEVSDDEPRNQDAPWKPSGAAVRFRDDKAEVRAITVLGDLNQEYGAVKHPDYGYVYLLMNNQVNALREAGIDLEELGDEDEA